MVAKKYWKKAVAIPVAIVATAAMMVLALPPCGYWYFGWIALVPILVATRKTRFLYGFFAAILASLAAGFISVHGIFYDSTGQGGEPMWTYLGFCLFGSVLAIVAGIYAEDAKRDLRNLLTIAAVGVLLDASLLWVMPAPLALSQSRHFGMLLLASVTGIWGVSFLIWFANLALAECLVAYRRYWYLAALFLVVICGTSITFPVGKTNDEISVGVVQSDSTELDRLAHLSRSLANTSFVVWPEFSGLAHVPNGDTSRLRKLAAESGQPAFVTTFHDAFEPLPHNVAALFSSSGESDPYFKRKLFGNEVRMHTPGTKAVVVRCRQENVGLNICYDTCYPSIIRESALKGADVIALPTIDPRSPFDFLAAGHAAFSPFRAAENGVSIVRADGNAYSSVVDPWGRTVFELHGIQNGNFEASIPAHGHWTVYRRFGDWFLWLCAGGVLLSLGKTARSRFGSKGSREIS